MPGKTVSIAAFSKIALLRSNCSVWLTLGCEARTSEPNVEIWSRRAFPVSIALHSASVSVG